MKVPSAPKFEIRETSTTGAIDLFIDGQKLHSVVSFEWKPGGNSEVDRVTLVFNASDVSIKKLDWADDDSIVVEPKPFAPF